MKMPKASSHDPARVGACHLVRWYVRHVRKTERRLDRHDPETLHEFRAALRRLRSALRAYAPALRNIVPRTAERRLRTVAHATNTRRDVDVHLAWLHHAMPTFGEAERRGAQWLCTQLEAEARHADIRLARTLRRKFHRTLRRLRKRTRAERHKHEPSRSAATTLGAVTGALVQTYGDALVRELQTIHTPLQQRELHDARIAGKHLRYLLEPFAATPTHPGVGGVPELLEELQHLQNQLGEVHDAYVLSQHIAQWRDCANIDHAGQLGLRTLAARVYDRQLQGYTAAATQWFGVNAVSLQHAVSNVAAALITAGS